MKMARYLTAPQLIAREKRDVLRKKNRIRRGIFISLISLLSQGNYFGRKIILHCDINNNVLMKKNIKK